MDSHGNIQWNFSEQKSDFASLQPGQVSIQNFVITLTTSTSTTTIPVKVTVYDADLPPVIVADVPPVAKPVALAPGQENAAYTITAAALLTGVTDIDGSSLLISAVRVHSGGGTIVDNHDGTWTYTPAANYEGPVTFDYTVLDGTLTASSTASLNLINVNDAAITVPGAQTAAENNTLAVSNGTGSNGLSGISISDADATGAPLTTTLSVLHGTLTVASAGGAAVTGSGTGTVTLTGTVAEINATLAAADNIVYKAAPEFSGRDTLTVHTDDGGNAGTSATVPITVTPVADAPTLSGPLTNAVSDDFSAAATPLHVSLNWVFSDASDYLAVTDRTNGATESKFGGPANGIEFMANWLPGQMRIVDVATNQSVWVGANFSAGTYRIDITDDGAHQTFVITDATGHVVASAGSDFADTAAGNLVTFTNREANDGLQHTATIGNVAISTAYHGLEDGTVALTGFAEKVSDTDGSETMVLKISGFPAGAVFSKGALVTNVNDPDFGKWVISNPADIASLATTPLTVKPPVDYNGSFTLHVDSVVTAAATLPSGGVTDTKTFSHDIAVTVDPVNDVAADATTVIAPDDAQHAVFTHLTISPDFGTIDHATVTWSNITASGTVSFEGLPFDNHVVDGITVTLRTDLGSNHNLTGYELTGLASASAYTDVLSHLAFQSLDTQSPTFTVVVNDGTGDSAPATATVNVAPPLSWDVWTGAAQGNDWNNSGNWTSDAHGSNNIAYVKSLTPISFDVAGSFFNGGENHPSIAALYVGSGTEIDLTTSNPDQNLLQVTGALANAGTIHLGPGVTLEVSGTLKNHGTIAVDIFTESEPGATLLIDGTVMLDGNGTVTLDGTNDRITGTYTQAAASTLENVNNHINGFGKLGDGHLHLINDAGGVIDATGILTLNTGNTITNAGLLEATNHGTLDVQDRTIANTGTGIGHGIVIDGTSTFLVDTSTLKLTGGGAVSLQGGNIAEHAVSGSILTLDNVDNTISGTGTIGSGDGKLALQNDGGATTDATGGALILDTGRTITNSGLLEATNHGTLDVQDSAINNTGIGTGRGIVIDGTSALLVDTSTLQLTGGGAVSLQGGNIAEQTSNQLVTSGSFLTLDNVDNIISGTGTIGNLGDGKLALQNDGSGTIDATGGTLTLDTGRTITNSGLLEATNHGTLDVQDHAIANTGTGIGRGIVIDGTSTLLVDTSTLQLTGGGALSLQGGNIAEHTVSGSLLTLDNVDNTISGTGTIGTGDGHLALINETGGTIDAIGGKLTLNTGNTITNSGLLETTRGGTLDIADNIHNIGAGASGILVGAASTLLVDHVGNDFTFTLQLDGHGTVSLEGGRITENASNQFVVSSGMVLALDNVDNTIAGYGSIGSGDGHLRLKNDAGGTIDASGGTLILDTGYININSSFSGITNNGLLEATAGGTLVVDDAVTGTGQETIADSGVLKLMSSVASTQTVTYTGAGTLYLGQPASFSGKIAGISGNDILDLAGFNAATTSVTAGSYSNGVTVLTVTDSSDNHSTNLTLSGDYHSANFARSSDGNGGTSIILNQQVPTPVTATAHSFTPTTSHVYRAQAATISSNTSSGLFINIANDTTASDLIVVELDQASQITATGDGFNGVSLTTSNTPSSAASVAVFNAASISSSGNISASGGGIGIFASANGNVAVNDLGNVSGVRFGIEAFEASSNIANVDVNVGPAAIITATSSYGILAINIGAGNISVRTSSGDHINSGGAGIDAVNEATAAPASAHSTIVVNAAGAIHSGSGLTGTNAPPAGILAGYFGSNGNTDPTTYPIAGLFGDVLVNSSADITADAGDGIRAYNYGTGDVTVNDNAATIIALGGSGPTQSFGNGIAARNFGAGNTHVYTAPGTVIHSGSSGIAANNASLASPSTDEVSVLAYGTITSGTIASGGGSPAAGILAGYNANGLAQDNVHGNVLIDDYASITAPTGTDGIRGYNYGTGTVTIVAEAGAIIIADRYGIAGRGHDGGDVSVINHGSVTATTAIDATTTTGHVHIENHGTITGDIIVGDATFTGHATVDNEAGATWNLVGNSTFAGTSELINHGTIDSNGTSSITTTGVLNFTNTGTVNVQSGTLDMAASVAGPGSFTIGDGAQLEFGTTGTITGVSGQTITFEGHTGTLKIDNAASFHSTIAGLGDDGTATYAGADHIDLVNVAFSSLMAPTFDSAHDILTVSDGTHTAALQLTGPYSLGNFQFQDDGNGGTVVWDPPAPAAGNAFIASGPNATLTGTGGSDNFVFNFAAVGRAIVTNFHADTDLLQLKASSFATVQALLDATRDDGHGNTVIALDAHDSITLAGVTKAQLHQTDFHLV